MIETIPFWTTSGKESLTQEMRPLPQIDEKPCSRLRGRLSAHNHFAALFLVEAVQRLFQTGSRFSRKALIPTSTSSVEWRIEMSASP